MGFWGIEVKPGKPYPYHSDHVPGRLHVTQATLGLGTSTERSIVQCTIGHKSPIFLCSLLPNKNESSSLNLEFDEEDLIAFSVIGPRSVHLSGYFEAFEDDSIRDDYESDSLGEDIADTESGSSDFGSSDEYGDDSDDEFIDEDDAFNMYSPPSAPKSGVIIEEIVDEEKPANGNLKSKRQKKKNQSSGPEDDKNSQHQIVVRGDSGINVLESEDEDGFPISKDESKSKADVKPTDNKSEKTNKKERQDSDATANLKRKVENTDEGHPEKKKKNKKNKQLKEQTVDEAAEKQSNEKSLDTKPDQTPSESQIQEEKKKTKKKNKKSKDNEDDQTVTPTEDQKKSSLASEQKKTTAKSSKVKTFPNGLVIEDLEMGQPDGKRASRGNNVSVCYIGKLKKDGKIFDSNVGRAPFKFRLGTGQVIKGWDVGVNGMRVGDKRRLTIPPEMGYGSKNVGKIPANSWLVFDVELINVR